MFTDIYELKKYINVSGNLDIALLEPYQEEALRKIYGYVPKSLLDKLETERTDIYELLRKSVANYTVVFSLPFLKIHLSNTGGNNFQDGKMKTSEWWDLRDFGISAKEMGDRALGDAFSLLYDSVYKTEITAFADEDLIFKTPKDFECVYPIGGSWEVFMKLRPVIRHVWRAYLQERLKECTVAELAANAKTAPLLKEMAGCYAVADAVGDASLLFTQTGMVIGWEQLPWQKSRMLGDTQIGNLRDKYTRKANLLFDMLVQILKDNPDDFPCFRLYSPMPIRTPQTRKSGLYL